MGLLDKIGGAVGSVFGMGSKAPKQKPSASEIALAQVSGQLDQRYQTKYVPMEAYEIEQWRDPTTRKQNRALLAGRISADVARAEADANASNRGLAAARNTGTMGAQGALGVAETGQLTSAGLADAAIDASRGARSISDDEATAILRTGHDINRGTVGSLGGLARAENYEAAARLKAKSDERDTNIQAMAQIASVGGMQYDNRRTLRELERMQNGQTGLPPVEERDALNPQKVSGIASNGILRMGPNGLRR